jgi:hypothetical protein
MSESTGNGLSFNGKYNLRYIALHSFRYEGPIDITDMFSSMEIYESIDTPFITIKLNLIDQVGLIDNARVIGDEFIHIDVRGADDVVGIIDQYFYIYKITDRLPISDRGVTYTLHCMSRSALNEVNTLVSKSFNGQPSELAKTILTDYMGTDKEIYAEETKNKIQYISNYWSPVRNLKFLADRSISKETMSPAYVFYETKRSYIFASLNNLINQPAAYQYFYSVNTKQVGAEIDKAKIIEKLYIDTGFDYIQRLKTGAYGNRSLIVNPMDKTYRYSYYDFIESYDKNARLNEMPFTSDDAPRRIHSMFNYRVAPTVYYHAMDKEYNEEWFSQNITEHAAKEAQSIQIDVSGRFSIYAGNVIEVYMYSEALSRKDDMYSGLDSVYSGRYLVKSIKHTLDRERHMMSLQLNKDSLIKLG